MWHGASERKDEMKTYEFRNGEKTVKIEASSYDDALADLIFKVGSEAEAAEWTFVGA